MLLLRVVTLQINACTQAPINTNLNSFRAKPKQGQASNLYGSISVYFLMSLNSGQIK